MNKVRLGLIGAGAIARKHLEVIRGIDWIEAVAITSRTKSRAEQLAKEHGIAVCADDINSLIRLAKPDALMVLVSVEQMYRVTSSVIPFGLPLFIEKPPGLNPEENERLVLLARRYSVPTMVGFNRRYYSIFHKAIQIVRQHGSLRGVYIEGHERMWLHRQDGKFSEEVLSRWIYANSIHTIDLLRFFGGEPVKVMSLAHRYREPLGDQFVAIMEFESGALGQYSAYWYSPGGWRVVLYGDGVMVEFKPLEKGIWVDKDFKTHQIEPDEVDIRHKPGFFRQMEAFGNLVRNKKSVWPYQDLGGAYKTMFLAKEISSGLHDKEGLKREIEERLFIL